ncbi:hypothetical protein V5799_007638, partial [Amblyomma americanum]
VLMPARESIKHHGNPQGAHGTTMMPGFSRSEDYRSITTCNDDPDPPTLSEDRHTPPHCNGKIPSGDDVDEGFNIGCSLTKPSKSEKSAQQRHFHYSVMKGLTLYGTGCSGSEIDSDVLRPASRENTAGK